MGPAGVRNVDEGMTRFMEQLRRVRRSVIFRNAAALYLVQAAGYALPLITLPYLARVLRPDGWGMVIFAQAFATWVAVFVQYGFGFSGSRAIAREREDVPSIERTVARVQTAKAILILGSLGGAGLTWALVSEFRSMPLYLILAWIAGVAQGASPTWFFQGMERLGIPAAVEVVARGLATAGVFLLVRSPTDGWIVLALRAVGEIGSIAIVTSMMYRRIGARMVGAREALATLREGWPLFVFAGAATLYTTGNAFVLGVLSTPAQVSFFGGAERITRAVSMLVHPISQALYPRMSHLAVHEPARAAAMLRRALPHFVLAGAALSLGLFSFAPVLVPLVMGDGYLPAIEVVRVLSVLPTLIALGTVIGVQWALPAGHDRPYSRLVLAAGLVNIILGIPLASSHGALGMAVSAVVAETLVETGLIVLLVRHGWAPARDGATAPSGSVAPPQAASSIKHTGA